jgi:hypothetical protein
MRKGTQLYQYMYDRLFQWEKGHNSISICMIVYFNEKRDTTLSVYVWSSISMRKGAQLYKYIHDRLFQLEKGHNSISICMIVYFNEKRGTTLSVYVWSSISMRKGTQLYQYSLSFCTRFNMVFLYICLYLITFSLINICNIGAREWRYWWISPRGPWVYK